MDFTEGKPIYRQITDYCYDRIASGDWPVDGRIPSTKDLCIEMGVNNRTVLKAFDDMADAGVIYQKRGMGYFVAPDASNLIMEERRAEFLRKTLPEFKEQMQFLGFTPAEVAELLTK